MKNGFLLLGLLLFVSGFFLRCNNQTNEPTEDATVASPLQDSTENIFATPAPFVIHIKAQYTKPSRCVDDAIVIINRLPATTYPAPDGVALVKITKGDELEIQGPKDDQNNPIYEPLTIILTDITNLQSLTVYLKFVKQKPDAPKDHYVFGKVYNDSRTALKDVYIYSPQRNFTFTTLADGEYKGIREEKTDFDLKFSKDGETKAELQLKGVKDTLQLDVFLDDNPIHGK